MSQLSGFATGGALPPQVPTEFTTDAGIAIPSGNNLNIFGGTGITTTAIGSTVTITLDTPVSIANGGTNATSFTNVDGVVYFDGTRLVDTDSGAAGQVLTSNGAGMAPTFQTTGGASITITGDTGGAITSGSFTFTGGGTGLTFNGAATTETLGGTLVVPNGGTGQNTLINHGVLVGAGTSGVSQTAVGATNTVLLGNTGADPSFGSVPNAALANSSITLTSGTGITVTGSPVSLGGSATIALSVPVSIANGGTNTTSFATTDGTVYYNGTRLTVTATGSSGQVLTSQGAGSPPQYATAPGIATISGDTGSVTGSTVSIKTNKASGAGSTLSFTGSTTNMVFNSTDSLGNVIIGKTSGNATITGSNNTVIGFSAAPAYTTGHNNVGVGATALFSDTAGINNVAIGYGALISFNGSANGNNISIGTSSASAYTGTESNNIVIGSNGVNGESSTIHIGDQGMVFNSCSIGGIVGVTVTGSAVLVSGSNQLGVAVSSKKYKENIQDMGSISEDIMKLRPVAFNYIVGEDKTQQTGLIAEEVHEVMPSLVVYDKSGDPQTVKYHDLAALLLNEVQKLRKEVDELKRSK